jgi:S-adenosylmethionine hydrolase
MANPPIITLLTDFGLSDHYVAAMKGVILGICADARLVDITHEVKAFGIAEAAFTLAQSWPCFPAGTVHLVVVDPGVGSSRRPLLAEAHGHTFIAPDNGILTMVLRADPDAKIRGITEAGYFRLPVSRTFHGRDIFSPAAAHRAAGVPPSEFGSLVGDPVLLPIEDPNRRDDGSWTGRILHVDRYGNLITNLPIRDFPDTANRPFDLLVGGRVVVHSRSSYAASLAGELFVIEGSSGYLEISLNQGDASELTGAAAGSPFTFRRTSEKDTRR